VIVEMASGGSWLLFGDPSRSKTTRMRADEMTVLVDLLADGWTPVRETATGTSKGGAFQAQQSTCLVLLSKDD